MVISNQFALSNPALEQGSMLPYFKTEPGSIQTFPKIGCSHVKR